MKLRTRTVLKYVFFLGVVAFLLLAFLPRTYEVPPLQAREGTLYWDLPTGSRIAYIHLAAQGTKKPYPIIFLQGGPGGFISARNIQALAPFSADGYDIYLYDQIGSGRSARLANIQDYTAHRHKRDLEEIVERIGAEKVILIGQSWGAVLATLYIADHADKVQRVVFTGPGPIQPARAERFSTDAPDSMDLKKPLYSNKEANARSTNLRMDLVRSLARSFGFKLAPDGEVDAYQTYLNKGLNKAIVCDTAKAPEAEAGGGFYAQVMTVRSFKEIKDPRPKLKGSMIPILLLKGQCDDMPWGSVKEYLELFPEHELRIIPGAGHSISVERPAAYRTAIRDFLARDTHEPKF